MNLLARNVLWVGAGQTASLLVQAGYFLLVTRLLGAREFGVYVGVYALVVVLSQYSNVGAGSVLLRRAAVDPATLPLYWGNVLLSTLTMGAVTTLFICVVGRLVEHSAGYLLLLTMATSDCLFLAVVNGAGQAFQSQERMPVTAALNLSANLIRLIAAGILFIVLKHADAQQWALAVLCSSVLVATVAFIVVTRSFGWPRFEASLIWLAAPEGLSFALTTSTSVLYNDLDKILLSHYGFIASNGTYSAAYRVLNVANMPAYALYNAAVPKFFRLGAQGIGETAALARKLVVRSTPLMVVVAAGLFVVAPSAAAAFGVGFHDTALALRWLCFLPLIRSLQWSAGDAITGVGKQQLRLLLQGIVVVLNLGLNIVLIPRYSWRGAVYATLATDTSLAILSWATVHYLCIHHARRTGGGGPELSVVPADGP